MIDENFRKSANSVLIESECLDKSHSSLTMQRETPGTSSVSSPPEPTRFHSLERKLLDALGVQNS